MREEITTAENSNDVVPPLTVASGTTKINRPGEPISADTIDVMKPDQLANKSFSWLDQLFLVTMFHNLAAATKQEEEEHTLLSLKQRLLTTSAPIKQKLPLLKLACFGDEKTPLVQKDGRWTGGSLRHNANVRSLSGLETDYDGEKVPFDEAVNTLRKAGIVAVVYTSPSHTADTPRWRVLCPFSKKYPPERRDDFMGRLHGLFGGIFCDASWTLSQGFYYGHLNGNQEHRVEIVDGTPIDLHDELDATWLGKAGKSEKPSGKAQPRPAAAATPSPLSSGGPAAAFAGFSGSDMNAAARAGLNKGFGDMPGDRQDAMLVAMLACPAILALANVGRKEGWRDVLFALADAERLGATGARALALAWCQTSPRFIDVADFNKDWISFRSKPDGITIGTLLALARDAGFNIAAWFREFPTVGKPPSWDTVPAIMDTAQAGPLLNQFIGFARQFGGGPSYFLRRPDGTVSPIGKDALAAVLAPYKVCVGTGTEAKLISAVTWWTTWHGRYAVGDVVYDPEGVRARGGEIIENTWRGFAVKPVQGSWQLIYLHLLNIICDGNNTYCDYLIKWFAHAVQRPGTAPEVMVVIRSNQEGVGKSTVGQLMLRIFGPHGHEASGLKEIFGEFNEVVVNKTFVLLEEEPFPGNHQLAAAIKAVVTAGSISINPKGRPRYSILNMLHLLLTTNAEWAFPAGAAARRALMLDATRKEGDAYFAALWGEINGAGVAAMLHDLLRIDLSGFNPRAVPVTAALVRQQRMTADDIYQWATSVVVDGVIVPWNPLLTNPKTNSTASEANWDGGFGWDIPTGVIYASYCETQRGQRTSPKAKIEFGRHLKALGMVRCVGNKVPTWTVPNRAAFFLATEQRAGIRQVTP